MLTGGGRAACLRSCRAGYNSQYTRSGINRFVAVCEKRRPSWMKEYTTLVYILNTAKREPIGKIKQGGKGRRTADTRGPKRGAQDKTRGKGPTDGGHTGTEKRSTRRQSATHTHTSALYIHILNTAKAWAHRRHNKQTDDTTAQQYNHHSPHKATRHMTHAIDMHHTRPTLSPDAATATPSG